jgi:hypothetical protein
MVAPMTQASLSKRRGQGEDSIYWDASKNRYIGAVSLGFSPSGARIRKKVTGRTKTEVRDKLRELHKQVEGGLRPRRRYTVEDALEDWLAVGLDGLSAKTVTLYRGTIAKALREELGSVRLTDLTAADVQKALTSIASRVSTRTVQIAHNVLVRAIRQAERDDLATRQYAQIEADLHSYLPDAVADAAAHGLALILGRTVPRPRPCAGGAGGCRCAAARARWPPNRRRWPPSAAGRRGTRRSGPQPRCRPAAEVPASRSGTMPRS